MGGSTSAPGASVGRSGAIGSGSSTSVVDLAQHLVDRAPPSRVARPRRSGSGAARRGGPTGRARATPRCRTGARSRSRSRPRRGTGSRAAARPPRPLAGRGRSRTAGSGLRSPAGRARRSGGATRSTYGQRANGVQDRVGPRTTRAAALRPSSVPMRTNGALIHVVVGREVGRADLGCRCGVIADHPCSGRRDQRPLRAASPAAGSRAARSACAPPRRGACPSRTLARPAVPAVAEQALAQQLLDRPAARRPARPSGPTSPGSRCRARRARTRRSSKPCSQAASTIRSAQVSTWSRQ